MRFLSLSLRLVALVALARAQYSNQIIMDDPAQPPAPLTRPQPSLADLLTIDQSVSIFYSYLRDTGMTARLDDAAVSTTVLAPKNRAVVALPVKPHQDLPATSGEVQISQEQFDKLSKQNVERWISAHLLPGTRELSSGSFATLLDGKSVTFTDTKQDSPHPEWERFVVDGDVRIVDRKEASNGVLYVIDGTIKPA